MNRNRTATLLGVGIAGVLGGLLVCEGRALAATTTPQQTLKNCQKAVAAQVLNYGTAYQRAVGGCMDRIATVVVANGAPIAGAAPICAVKLRNLVNTTNSSQTLAAKLATKIGKACDPLVSPTTVHHAIADILGTGTLGEEIQAQNLNTWCQGFSGDGSIDDLPEWVACMTKAATCDAQQNLATKYPRLLEWLAAIRAPIDAMDASKPNPVVPDALTAVDSLVADIDSNNDHQIDLNCGPLTGSAPCPAGQTRSGGICVDCPLGRSNAHGLGACDICPAGTFSAVSGAATCTPCTVGKFQASAGATTCGNCTAGTFQDAPGQAACDTCPAGTFSGSGAAACTPCSVGSGQSTPGSAVCNQCPLGTYQDTSGQATCKPCPLGKFSTVTGASTCTDCPVGKFGAATGVTTCSNCTAGTFQDTTGQAACDTCPAGTFSGSGAAACTPCSVGSGQSTPGSAVCNQCPLGTYQDTSGQATCKPCPLGKFSTVTGASTCTDCPVGKFGAATGLTTCSNCNPGTFQDLTGQATCKSCVPGTFTSVSASSTCNACVPGQFQSSSGSTTCQSCASGTYNPATGQAACFPCSGAPGGSTGCSCTFP